MLKYYAVQVQLKCPVVAAVADMRCNHRVNFDTIQVLVGPKNMSALQNSGVSQFQRYVQLLMGCKLHLSKTSTKAIAINTFKLFESSL